MLLRKMIRDMRAQKAQFISIVCMLFIGFFVFGGMSAIGDGMQSSSRSYYAKANLADMMIYCEGISQENVETLAMQQNVNAAERRAQFEANVTGMKDVVLTVNVLEGGQISRPLSIEGKTYSDNQQGIWLDRLFAKEHGLQVGEKLAIQTPNGDMKLTIQGLVMQPEYIYAVQDESQLLPEHKKYGYAFLSGMQYPQITNAVAGSVYSQILMDGKMEKKALTEYTETYLEGKHAVIIQQDDFPSLAMFANEIEQQKAMRVLFPIAFLLIALLTMMTALTRMTANQRVQIGTMKAVGIAEWKIYLHYLMYGILPAFVGSVSGVVLGSIWLSKLMFYFQSKFYAMPEWESGISLSTYAVVVLCIFICAFVAYLACWKELRQAAADILRPKRPTQVKSGHIEQSRWWQNCSFKVRWNVRDVMRNKMRSLITVVGVAGCMMLLLCAFGLKDTMDELMVWMYEDICQYDTKVVLKDTNNERQKGAQYIQEGQAQVKISGKISEAKELQNLTVTEPGTYLKYTDKKRNSIVLKDVGVAVTCKTAEQLGVKKGDVISWKPYGSGGSWISSEITTLIRSPLVQGLYFTQSAYETEGMVMKPTAFLTDKKISQFIQNQYQSVQSKQEIIKEMTTMMETLNVMIGILIGAAVFLGLVVLYNLGVLSFAEKESDLKTLRVLGFADAQVRTILGAQNYWLTMVGILSGIPLGIMLLRYLMQYMGDTMDVILIIYTTTYLVCILGIMLLSMLINHVVNKKVSKLSMT